MLDQFHSFSTREAERRPFRKKRRAEERVELLGGRIDLVKSSEVFHFVAQKVAIGGKAVVANHNLHSLYLHKTEPEVRAFFRAADVIEVDSIPLILWARLLRRPSRRFHRCTYLDWRREFWEMAERMGWSVFFAGGKPGVAEKAAAKIRAQWPNIRLETHHGFFDMTPGSSENEELISKIHRFSPNILLVGMGMPRQETWIARNYDALPPCVMFTVGGAFDYEAGVQFPCPRWIGRLGFEWLFRLITNPKLFGRYVIEPWSLLGLAIADLARVDRRRAEQPPQNRTLAPRINQGIEITALLELFE